MFFYANFKRIEEIKKELKEELENELKYSERQKYLDVHYRMGLINNPP